MITDFFARWGFQGYLLLPLLLALVMAVGDLRSRRIPNYLTLGAALAGLGFQLGFHGLGGLIEGVLGLALGLGFLLLPYILGGVGAGDVKALAALGAWLNPAQTFQLFIYMALCGGGLALATLWWKGQLWPKIRHTGALAVNWVLSHPHGTTALNPTAKAESLPYGLALALGMTVLFFKGI